jgi:alkanesulfonate monooxygenase SsuD/methylene tetrahydromethanopterin reductase-like flavin-dependent oxidoreductase (luciferase family)
MEFGLFDQLPCAPSQDVGARYNDIIAQGQLADRLGLDAIWLAEYHFNSRFSVLPAPLLLAAAIARCTERVKIATAVNLLPLHQPVRLAEEWATLDVLSGGRAIFGIGRGSNPEHYQGMGIATEEGRPRFLEALEVVIKCWTEERLDHQGEFFQAEDVAVVPKPVQQPHPPVYVASNSADTFPMVGTLGHNLLVTPLIITKQGVKDGLAAYRKQLVASGHDPAKVKVLPTLAACVAESREKAEAVLRPTIDNYLGVLRGGRSRGSGRAATITTDEFLRDYAIVGGPEECVEQIEAIREMFDCQGVIFWHNIGGLVPHEQITKSLQLFSDKVLPHFR